MAWPGVVIAWTYGSLDDAVGQAADLLEQRRQLAQDRVGAHVLECLGRRPLVPHAPTGERAGDRQKLTPALGQLHFHARRHFAKALAREQAERDHLAEVVVEDTRTHSGEAVAQDVEAQLVVRQSEHDQQRPAVAHGGQRTRKRSPLAVSAHGEWRTQAVLHA